MSTSLAFRRRVGVVLASLVALLTLAAPAFAHPLGNFTINTAIRVVVGTDVAAITYIVDLAEIPTVQAKQRIDADGDGVTTEAELADWGQARCDERRDGIVLTVADAPVELGLASVEGVELLPGQAGLEVLRLTCELEVPLALSAPTSFTLRDDNGVDRIGWREITVVGDGTTLLDTDVATASTSDLLRTYPQDRLASPLDVREASFTARPGGPRLGDDPGAVTEGERGGPLGALDRLTTAYTDLVARQDLTFGFGLFAIAVAVLLGSLHALAPGHGKTVMAAYVVGERGTLRQAMVIGVTVAVTHTLGVLTLGLVLSASETLAPERLYPYFGALSGAFIVAIGLGLLRRAYRSRRALATPAHDDHGHAHAHPHDEHGHDDHGHEHAVGGTSTRAVAHTHGGSTHSHVIPTEPLTPRTLIALGFAGGLVPSPSALLVLLGAIALGRTWFGVALVIAYGLGLAATLVGGGLLLLKVRVAAEGWLDRAERVSLGRWTTLLPLVTAILVVLGGTLVIVRALATG